MLKIDGKRVMEACDIAPSAKIGYILHALFNEVIEDPKLNTPEYLEKKAVELSQLSDEKLKEIGEIGKEKKEEEDKKDIEEIRRKHHVS
jgi:hypothetical protein